MSIKNRIILTFTLLTTLLVVVLARVSYVSVREIYLDQLAEQTQLLARLIGNSVDTKYLSFVEGDNPSPRAQQLYTDKIGLQAAAMLVEDVFIFDRDFKILAQSSEELTPGSRDSRLLLNRREIQDLAVERASTSLPFRGKDGQWYLWGFFRLDDNYWVGVQESARRLEKVESLANVFWLIGIAGVLITALCGWLLARAIARPIDRLVSFSEMLGKGDFAAQLPTGVSGELAILANALDKMRHDLARHHQEKETMLAQIAHEIRNPLGGIELLAGLVKEDLQRNQADTEYIGKILDEIAGLKGLITAYLNYSRPSPPAKETVKVTEVVAEVRDSLKNKLAQKKAMLMDTSNGETIEFDRRQLRQILQNLVNNSLEMMNSSGNILIETQRNGSGVEIRICDDGPGIPETEMGKIFEPFFTTRATGTGLGLAICKKFCRENNAEIFAENRKNGGSVFIIKKSKEEFAAKPRRAQRKD